MSVSFVLEALVVLGCIVMGTRAGGVGVGLWGGLGTFVLVFVFGEAPGAPPAAAVAIILAVVTTAALMQAAGGIDWMVYVAAKVIESRPKQITLIAPLTAFAFCVGAGTGNIIYPLMPVIYDVAYRNHIRPSRPLTVTVVQSGIALAASPVSAAMAAMLTLTDVEPYNLGLTQILAITLPACVIGIIVTSLVVNRMWAELDDDPEVQAKIASGELVAPAPVTATAGSRGTSAGGGHLRRREPRAGRRCTRRPHRPRPRSPTPRQDAGPRWPSSAASSRSCCSACSRACARRSPSARRRWPST